MNRSLSSLFFVFYRIKKAAPWMILSSFRLKNQFLKTGIFTKNNFTGIFACLSKKKLKIFDYFSHSQKPRIKTNGPKEKYISVYSCLLVVWLMFPGFRVAERYRRGILQRKTRLLYAYRLQAIPTLSCVFVFHRRSTRPHLRICQ